MRKSRCTVCLQAGASLLDNGLAQHLLATGHVGPGGASATGASGSGDVVPIDGAGLKGGKGGKAGGSKGEGGGKGSGKGGGGGKSRTVQLDSILTRSLQCGLCDSICAWHSMMQVWMCGLREQIPDDPKDRINYYLTKVVVSLGEAKLWPVKLATVKHQQSLRS